MFGGVFFVENRVESIVAFASCAWIAREVIEGVRSLVSNENLNILLLQRMNMTFEQKYYLP